MKYLVITYKTLFGSYKIVELSDQSYGQWVIYQKKIPKYEINVFNVENESDIIIKYRLSEKEISMETLIDSINKEHKSNLHLAKKKFFSIKTGTEIIELSLESIPIELLK